MASYSFAFTTSMRYSLLLLLIYSFRAAISTFEQTVGETTTSKQIAPKGQMVLLTCSKLCLGCTDNLVWCKPELDQQIFQRSRRAKGVHPNDRSLQPGVMCPAKGRGLLHGNPCRDVWRRVVLTVVLRFPLKQFPGGHTHHTRLDPLLLELFVGL